MKTKNRVRSSRQVIDELRARGLRFRKKKIAENPKSNESYVKNKNK